MKNGIDSIFVEANNGTASVVCNKSVAVLKMHNFCRHNTVALLGGTNQIK